MEYTISAAFVLDVEDDKVGETDLHKDIVQHVATLAELMRAKYPDAAFKVILADMIISAPERILGEKR